MGAGEPREVGEALKTSALPFDVRAAIDRHAAWLLDPSLEVCVVGSAALAEACSRYGLDAPRVGDVDLAWRPTTSEGAALLERHGVALPITAGSRERGTLAFRLGGHRIEITSFRGESDTATSRIEADLARRDMTIGAIAWQLAGDRLIDPYHGLDHWRRGRIEAVGDPADRVAEHPIRYLRYFRRAHTLGFELCTKIRRLRFAPEWARALPGEAIAGELRRILAEVASPGRCLGELHESGALATLAPELDPQFDGRPAGPLRYHPEHSQALHLIMVLEWAARETRSLEEPERMRVLVAALCHDLGKNLTPRVEWPSHRAHETRGLPVVRALLDRLPGLADAGGRRLAEAVCRLHLDVRRLRDLRTGTVADLYDQWFRAADFPLRAFALAIGADTGGRLGSEAEGREVAQSVESDIERIRSACGAIDAGAIRAAAGDDLEQFRNELHRARCHAIRAVFGRRQDSD